MDFLIREGKVGDLMPILDLIEELAVIKNRKVELSIYDLISDGFSLNPLYRIFVAENETKIIGFALFYKTHSINGKSLILEDVFVTKEYKKLGVGISLFAKCLEYAKKNSIYRFEWGVLESNKGLMELYRRVGANILMDTSVYIMNENDINKALENKKTFSKITSFKNVAIRFGKIKDMPSVLRFMKKTAIYKKTPCNVTVEDLVNDGFLKEQLFKTIVLEIDNKIAGVLMFYQSYSSFQGKSLIIEDLIIEKKYRGYGFGKSLNYKFFQYAKKHGKCRVEQAIYDSDKGAISRCLKMGAKKVEGMRLIQINYETLHNFINKSN